MRAKRYFLIVTAILSSGASACFYPPMVQPSPEQRDQILLPVPYDLAWDAVNNVVKQNELKIHAQDPTHGIIEAQTPHFTLQDADCGVVGTAVGKVKAEPAADASAVYNFYLTAADRESSRLAVQAVFSTPIRVPFRPLQNVDCISTGVQEARLLREIRDQANTIKRPTFKKPQAESERKKITDSGT